MNEKQQHEEACKGFNVGYLLEKHNPALAQKLRESINDQKNPFLLGMVKGAEQFNQESFFDSPLPNMSDRIEDLDINLDNMQERKFEKRQLGY